MRLKLQCETKTKAKFPYNYNYELQNIIYSFIQKSSPEFSDFLHNTGFLEDKRPFKLFTFSKLFFNDGIPTREGYSGVSSFNLIFSTPIQKSYEHLVLGIFAKQEFTLYFSKSDTITVYISNVESLPEPDFLSNMHFITLSPIVSAFTLEKEGKLTQHFLDYMNCDEKDRYINNIHQNLLRKYRAIHKKPFSGNIDFELTFDLDYILKKQGKIRKNIKFKRDPKTGKYTQIIGMEAPFIINADPELIKIGYQCGFGEKNSAGFGMVEKIM